MEASVFNILAVVALGLMVAVSSGVVYLTTMEWRDRRRRARDAREQDPRRSASRSEKSKSGQKGAGKKGRK